MLGSGERLDPREEIKAALARDMAENQRRHAANLARAAQEAQDKLAKEQAEREAEAARVAEEQRKAEEWAAIPDSRKIEMLFGHVAELREIINGQNETIGQLIRKTSHLGDPAARTEYKSPPPFQHLDMRIV